MKTSDGSQKIGQPKACILLLTSGCILRCKMCCLWQTSEKDIVRPGLKEWKDLISSLSKISGPGFNVIFGGGEPLLFPDILTELIAFCRQNKLRTSLATSGYLIDKRMAKRLVASGLDYIALSLYSLKKETHNFLRGMSDSYERLLRSIGYLYRFNKKLEIAIDTVIMAPNVGELLDLANWVINDQRIHSISFQAVIKPFFSFPKGEWHKTEEFGFLWPKDAGGVDVLIDGLIKLKEASVGVRRDKINNHVSQLELFKSYFRNPQDFIKRLSCSVIHGNIFIVSSDGNVQLCPDMEPIGNIRHSDISAILCSREAHDRYLEIGRCQKNCHHIINCWYEDELPQHADSPLVNKI